MLPVFLSGVGMSLTVHSYAYMLKQTLSQRQTWVFNRKWQRKLEKTNTTPKGLFDHFNINDWPLTSQVQPQPATEQQQRTSLAFDPDNHNVHCTFWSAIQSLTRVRAGTPMPKRPVEHCSERSRCSWPWQWPGKVRSLSSKTLGEVCGVPELD